VRRSEKLERLHARSDDDDIREWDDWRHANDIPMAGLRNVTRCGLWPMGRRKLLRGPPVCAGATPGLREAVSFATPSRSRRRRLTIAWDGQPTRRSLEEVTGLR
jgi:hypothetical protein